MLTLFMIGPALLSVSTSQVREAMKQQEWMQVYYVGCSGEIAVAEWVMTGGIVYECESSSALAKQDSSISQLLLLKHCLPEMEELTNDY